MNVFSETSNSLPLVHRKGKAFRRFGLMHIGHRQTVGILRHQMVTANVARAKGVDASAEQILDRAFLPSK